jgi:hypothetical protein
VAFEKNLASDIEGGVTWHERTRSRLRYKGLKIGKNGSTYRISDNNAVFVSGSHPMRDNTAPGICISYAQPVITYEMDGVTSGFPIPTTVQAQPLSISGRSYYPISSLLTGYGLIWFANYNNVVVKTGGVFPYSTPGFPYVTQVHSHLGQGSVIMAPTMDNVRVASSQGHDLAVAANYNMQQRRYSVVSYKGNSFPFYAPSTVQWSLFSDGLYPQIAGSTAGGAMTAYSAPAYMQSPAGHDSPVERRDILHAIHNTTAGVRKAAEVLSIDDLRRLAFSANDSALIHYGVASPVFVDIENTVTSLAWDAANDTLPYFWWGGLKHWIRSEAFEVPQDGGQLIFGTEVFARHVDDFGTDFRLAIEFRDAVSDQKLYEEIFNFAGFNPDSALYLEDRINLASISGNTVYFCINPVDTTGGCGFEPVCVLTPWFEPLEKSMTAALPAPASIQVGQNYPNPFNPSTVIPFELSADGHVNIQVFDMLGRPVRTLHDGALRSGRHSVTFDGSRLGSGVYLCRFSAFGRVVTVTMHLLR